LKQKISKIQNLVESKLTFCKKKSKKLLKKDLNEQSQTKFTEKLLGKSSRMLKSESYVLVFFSDCVLPKTIANKQLNYFLILVKFLSPKNLDFVYFIKDFPN